MFNCQQTASLSSVKMLLLPLLLCVSVAGDCVTRTGDPGECTRELDCPAVVRGR